MKESTGFADKHGAEIFEGDIVRMLVKEPFQDMHGNWCDYQAVKRPGGYALLYVRSEKGAELPLHYTGNYMSELAVAEEAASIKTVLFGTRMPFQADCFERREPEPYESFEAKSERLRAERALKQ